MGRVLGIAQPVVGNAGATRKANAAIHDQRFTVRTVIEAPDRIPVDGVIPGDLTAAGGQRFKDLFADGSGAERVQEDLDLNAGARLGGERPREGEADLPGPVNIGLDGY